MPGELRRAYRLFTVNDMKANWEPAAITQSCATYAEAVVFVHQHK